MTATAAVPQMRAAILIRKILEVCFMDKITEGLLRSFSAEYNIVDKPEEFRFECLAVYLSVYRHYSATAFHPADLVTGSGGDTGIDGVAIIVNNNLVIDADTVRELLEVNRYLDVTFVFVQAERSSNFDTSKIGQFGFGVKDFFELNQSRLVRNDIIKGFISISNEIFNHSAKFKGNPKCLMYYITTGIWQNDVNLVSRYKNEINDIFATGNFESVEFFPVGADGLQRLYKQAKNAISRTFIFDQRVFVPNVAGVEEAHIGFIGVDVLLSIVCDENDVLIDSLFYENVRGWEGYNDINGEIRETLDSNKRDRFVLLNNGITIIARSIRLTGHKFTIDDFQIVNGCQTTNVLYDNRTRADPTVRVPLRLICTTSEDVKASIITATNRQTAIKSDQFFASKAFSKKIEDHFSSYEPQNRMYYERRTHQYDSQTDVPKQRIITHTNLVRSIGGMFYNEPHRSTRNYKQLSERVGMSIFTRKHGLVVRLGSLCRASSPCLCSAGTTRVFVPT